MAYEGPQGGDIRATLALSQSEAQTGSSRPLTLPGGRRISVPVRAGIRNGEQILLLLREFQDSLGMTIIMVTHERPLAQKFANRIALLSDGRLVSDGAQR